ncbi:MAG: hypothetical protein U9R19_03925 [Bacteroidota bacterium]|nr:hypothetical protein [Bacteroidota bacterium]
MKKILVLSLICLFGLNLFGQYTIISNNIENGEETISTTYVDGEKIAFSDNENAYIMDFEKDMFVICSNAQQVYMENKISTLKEKMGKMRNLMIDELLKEMPAQQREQMREMYKKMMSSGDQPYTEKVEVKSGTATEKIAGYNCKSFIVSENGQEVEQLWITYDLRVFDWAKMRKTFAFFGVPQSYEDTDIYIDLLSNGSIMKSIDNETGDITITKEIKKGSINSKRFMPDPSFRKISALEFSKILMQEGDGEEEY